MKDYRKEILELLDQRRPGLTICPSELLSNEDKKDSRMMEEVRASAKKLVSEGLIEITQKGKAIDPNKIRGPIRLRKVQS